MEKFTTHSGVAAPLRRSNVDTDQIIPASYLKRVTRHGYEDALFSAWRKEDDFVLNQEPYKNATVLVAGPEFGTGSSREHAVWALSDYGFRAVISSSFADIFRGNSAKDGLVAAVVDQQVIESIWDYLDANPGAKVEVDLENQKITAGAIVEPFEIDPYVRWRLLEGLDEIGITERVQDEIDTYERARPAFKPVV
ncbi:MAG: 3-isopropylmalate dehydratase small subunit [Candidatus Nanopelagicales bacterium]